MKILHLTTSRSGGAGVAAMRLAAAQQDDVRTKVRICTPADMGHPRHGVASQKRMAFKSKILTVFQQTIAKKEIRFVSPLSISRLDWKYIQDYDPDIIHIHNWYNFLDLDDINQLLDLYKVVFTAHDERLLTGGCHITFGCDRFSQGCKACPQVRFASKAISNSANRSQKILSKSRNYSVIAPSNWLSEKFKLAMFVNPLSEIETIPNLIPLKTKPSKDRKPGSFFKFLFVMASTTSSNKGLPDVLGAIVKLSELNTDMKFQLQIAGVEHLKGWVNGPNLELICLGIQSEIEMQDLYRASDALIVASKSENSPNVISEAQIQGTLVIGSAVGGIPELIENKETGLLYEPGRNNLLSSLSEFINMTEDNRIKIQNAAHSKALVRHDLTRILDETFKVYIELLERDSK